MPTKSDIYIERNRLVALLSKIFPSCLGIDEKAEEGWKHVVYIELPTGQCSWHVPDFILHWYKHLEISDTVEYDGHTTEEKYERVKAFNSSMLDNSLSDI